MLTDTKTFPQIFVNGEFIGGAADARIKWKKGELSRSSRPPVSATARGTLRGDPFEFLRNG